MLHIYLFTSKHYWENIIVFSKEKFFGLKSAVTRYEKASEKIKTASLLLPTKKDLPTTNLQKNKMTGRMIGVIPEEQTSSSDSIKNWLKFQFNRGTNKRRKTSFEYEDGAITKNSTTPKNRMLRRSSSVGENIDKILRSAKKLYDLNLFNVNLVL